jgi:DNA-binding FadR family transcriptional regulator
MINKPLLKPFKTKRAFEEIYDQIRELIYSGVFKPGDKLPSERELVSQFKIGRMTVREGLRTLEQSGLIYIKHGSLGGAFVNESDTKVITRSISDMIKIGNVTLQELTEARLRIEKIILEFAIERINKDDLDLLKKNIEDSEQQMLKGERATKDHINFHIILAKSSKNFLFQMIAESIMDVTESFLSSFQPEIKYVNQVLKYHKKIYKAVREKNLQEAQKIMEKHLIAVNLELTSVAKEIQKS